MISKKYFLADGNTTNFLSEFIIKNDEFCRVYVSDSIELPVSTEERQALLADVNDWEIVNNNIVFYEAPASGKYVTIWVATTPEELDTYVDYAFLTYDNIDDVQTVASNIDNINTAAAGITGIDTVVANIADINTVATDIANVNAVGAVASSVPTVAAIDSDVTTVAGVSTDVTTVSASIESVTTTAANIASVNTVSTNISGINSIVTNLPEILDADNQAAAAAASAQEAAESAAGINVGDVETKTLTSGQTSVTFTFSTTYGTFYLTGADVDNGRLTEGVEYTVDHGTKTVTLLESYPAGTKLVMVYFTGDSAATTATIQQSQVTTVGGETSIAVGFEYIVASNSLFVYRNGTKLRLGADYTEADSYTINLAGDMTVAAGEEWQFVYFVRSISGDIVPASNVTYTTGGSTTNVQDHLASTDYVVGTHTTAINTINTKLAETVSVKDFGAVGDGVTDDTAAIQAAVTYAASNNLAIVDYTGSTYRLTGIVSTNNLEMYGNCTLAFEGSGYLYVLGSLVDVGNISAAASKADDTITASSVVGVSEDDILILHNTVTSSFSQHRPSYYDGEFVKVKSVSGSDITITGNLHTNYSGVSTDKVFKINTSKVILDGITVTSEASFTVRVIYGKDVVINNVHMSTTAFGSSLQINKCYNAQVTGGTYYTPYDSSTALCYGISIASSQYVTVREVYSFGGRHAVTTGGDGTDGSVPCRYIHIENSVLENDPASAVYCADFHGNTVDSYYKDCTIYGRIGLAGYDVSAIGCTVHSQSGSLAAPLGYHEVVGSRVLFKDCKAICGEGSTTTSIVSSLASSLVDNIDGPYSIVVEGLDAELNSSVTRIVNAYESSGQENAWVLRDFVVRGNLSGLAALIAYIKAGSGVDASRIHIESPRFNTSIYSELTKSGTTLTNTVIRLPSYSGSNANGYWTKFADGTMICHFDFSASSAISSAFLGGFRTGGLTWTYPEAFIATPEISITADGATCFSGSISTAWATNCLFFLTAITTQPAAARSAKMMAIGRWF